MQPTRIWRALVLLSTVMLASGCTTTRTITIATHPPGAQITVDGQPVGTAPVAQKLIFKGPDDARKIVASKPGYREQSVEIRGEYARDTLSIDLKPESRRFTFSITPLPAIIRIDGQQVTPEPVMFHAAELAFALDAKGQWTTHTVTAERPGFQPLTQTLRFTDAETNLQLALEAMRKDLSISSTPTGATVYFDGQELGKTPLTDSNRAFAVDGSTDQYLPHKLKLTKPGYDPVEIAISWDEGKSEYHVELAPKTKTVEIRTDPAGATVRIEGKDLKPDASGKLVTTLTFPPVNDKGELRTYTATVSKKTADSEWRPAELAIGWDQGKTDYKVTLKEIITRPVDLVIADPVRGDDGWELIPRRIATVAMKDVTEGPQKPSPVQLTQFAPGTMIDSIAVSPDGTRILFAQFIGAAEGNFRSQLVTVATDGSAGTTMLTDGKSLELTASYTPDGSQVVFSSNRAGKRPSVWQMDARGAPGITQLTSGDTTDLWPSIDSDPKPRLFYQALVDTRPDPRLYMTQLGTTIRTDLIQSGGQQPRISPKGDAIIFAAMNDKTGKRDIYRMSDKGGLLVNLTNTPDADESDPAWNQDGTRLAFVSDRGVNEEGMNNKDIWVIDLTRPERPVQITSNGSWDDSPGWDPTGQFIYFRSNRGGSWQIWRVAAK